MKQFGLEAGCVLFGSRRPIADVERVRSPLFLCLRRLSRHAFSKLVGASIFIFLFCFIFSPRFSVCPSRALLPTSSVPNLDVPILLFLVFSSVASGKVCSWTNDRRSWRRRLPPVFFRHLCVCVAEAATGVFESSCFALKKNPMGKKNRPKKGARPCARRIPFSLEFRSA